MGLARLRKASEIRKDIILLPYVIESLFYFVNLIKGVKERVGKADSWGKNGPGRTKAKSLG